MPTFLDTNFLLQGPTARTLYHEYAAAMPIFDFHSHLSAKEIATDRTWDNLGEIWLSDDHYKWRAMRANGIDESCITGKASWEEKFKAWAQTVPYTMRNPLYHWTHLELQRYFGIHDLLSAETATQIYHEASLQLQTTSFSARNLLAKMKVRAVCTTDDPVDDLSDHIALQAEGCMTKVLPTFRPDKAMQLSPSGGIQDWRAYIERLADVAGMPINSFAALIEALDRRHAYFHQIGGRLSDHGVAFLPNVEAKPSDVERIFQKAICGQEIQETEAELFSAACLYEVGKMNHARGWAQQFHVGILRNNNSRLYQQIGADIGCDSIGDYAHGPGLVRLLDRLDATGELTKTILYNSNPADNEVIATMIGNYQQSGVVGKMQMGAAWWFLDQKEGIEKQINALSAMGLLSRFVGMLTDSRSFLSFPRHEYFRRILCNLIGRDVDQGALPNDLPWLGKMVQDICYHNAVSYFEGILDKTESDYEKSI